MNQDYLDYCQRNGLDPDDYGNYTVWLLSKGGKKPVFTYDDFE